MWFSLILFSKGGIQLHFARIKRFLIIITSLLYIFWRMITLSLELSLIYSIVEKDCFSNHILKSAKSLLEADDIVFNMIL